MKNVMAWIFVVAAMLLPFIYGATMLIVAEAGYVTPPTIGYFVSLMVGGTLGVIGCIKLSDPPWRFRVLLATTAFVFLSEAVRGTSVFLDGILHPKEGLSSLSVFFFHGAAFVVLSFGILIFVGSTKWGKARGILVRFIGQDATSSEEMAEDIKTLKKDHVEFKKDLSNQQDLIRRIFCESASGSGIG